MPIPNEELEAGHNKNPRRCPQLKSVRLGCASRRTDIDTPHEQEHGQLQAPSRLTSRNPQHLGALQSLEHRTSTQAGNNELESGADNTAAVVLALAVPQQQPEQISIDSSAEANLRVVPPAAVDPTPNVQSSNSNSELHSKSTTSNADTKVDVDTKVAEQQQQQQPERRVLSNDTYTQDLKFESPLVPDEATPQTPSLFAHSRDDSCPPESAPPAHPNPLNPNPTTITLTSTFEFEEDLPSSPSVICLEADAQNYQPGRTMTRISTIVHDEGVVPPGLGLFRDTNNGIM